MLQTTADSPLSGAECTLEHLSTSDIEPQLRFDAWRQRAHRLVELEPMREGVELDAELVTVRDARHEFGTACSSEYATRAVSRHRTGYVDSVVVTTILAGSVRMEDDHDVRRNTLPGSVGLFDVTRAARYEWVGRSREAYLTLPRAEAVAALGGRAPGLMLSIADCTLAPALKAELAVMARLALALSSAERAGMLAATRALALLALHQVAQPAHDNDPADDAFGDLSVGRHAAAMHFMESHAHEPGLSPADIARGIGCSRTRLYAAFADRGESVMDALRELRLQRARAVLDRGIRVHLEALAWKCGFADASNFSRVFKARFELSPSEWIRRAQAARLRDEEPAGGAAGRWSPAGKIAP